MKRHRAGLLLSLLLCLALTGCWSRVEINDLGVISMMAVDRTEDGHLRLWVQVVIPARVGSAPGQGNQSSNEPFITLSAQGETIMEAAKTIQTEASRRLFWAHARVILIGENLARAGVRPVADFLTRHREMRLNNYLLVIKGDVAELMSTRINLEKLPAEKIREITRSRIGTVVTVGEWVEMLTARGTEPILGVVSVQQPPDGAPPGQNPSLRITGTALFHNDQLVGFMDETVTRGLLWLRNKVFRGVVTVEVPGAPGAVSVEWVSSHTQRRARLEGGQVVIDISARTEGDISEETAPLDLSDPKVLTKIEAEMNREIRQRMQTALADMYDLNVDAAGLGEVVHRHLPAVWPRLKKTWLTGGFKEAKVTITVDARVRRTGLSSKPKAVRPDELIDHGK